MSATVEFESSLEGNDPRNISSRHGSVKLLEGSIQVRHVSVVVLRVVDFHGFGGNDSFNETILVSMFSFADKGSKGGFIRRHAACTR